MRFSKIVVISIFVLLTIFTICIMATFEKTGAEPETLVNRVFGFFAVEGGALALIKICETKHEHQEKSTKEKESEDYKDERFN